jgi:hypothetical protein
MRTVFLAGVLCAMLPAHAATQLSAQYDANHTLPSQEYLGETITVELDAELTEGMLAYASMVAQGNKVTVVSSQQGIALFTFDNGVYQLVRELNKTELGLESYQRIDAVMVSASDSWLMYVVNGNAVSVPLDPQYQPLLSASSRLYIGYSNRMLINNGIAAVNSGYSVQTFAINDTTGMLSNIGTVQLQNYASAIALANRTLAVTQQSWGGQQENLQLYRLGPYNQWQYSAGHEMTHAQNGYISPNYLAFSQNGQNIIYGSSDYSYVLSFNSETAQLNEVARGQLLSGYYQDIRFLDDNNLLLRNNEQLSLLDSATLQTKANFRLEQLSNTLKDIAASSTGLTLLHNNGLTRLSASTLAVSAQLQPGEQDRVLNFSNTERVVSLNEDYILQIVDNKWSLFKLDQQGLPALKQTGISQQLLGHSNYYYQFIARNMGNNVYAILHGNNYAIVQLDTELDQLQHLNSGILQGRSDSSLYAEQNNVAQLGEYLLVANSDTLTLLRLTSDYQLRFVDAAVNGASGIAGIAYIQQLFIAGNHIYTVDQQKQVVAHFIIQNNQLQQKHTYYSYSFPTFRGYSVHLDIVTLRSDRYLHSFRVAEDGSLTLLSGQYLPGSISQWTNVGQRFAAMKSGSDIRIMELDSQTGVWYPALSMSNQQVADEFKLSQSLLLPLGTNLGLYDANNKRLVRLSHNSAPFVINPALQEINLNQGQTYQLLLNNFFADEEQNGLTFSLQNAAQGFSLTEGDQLYFDGEIDASGSFDLLAQDQAGLTSLARFSYQANLAPVAITTVPDFSATAGDKLQIELAQHFVDPEGQAMLFSLSAAQVGLSLSTTGLLTGTIDTAGQRTIDVNISDSAGANAQYTININVQENPKKNSGGSINWLLLSVLLSFALRRTIRLH